MTEGTAADVNEVVQRARALIFDFDGTLVDSNEIKWRGFETVFADAGDRLPDVMAYCRGSDHVIRGDKFRHVYERILHRPYTPEVAAALHARFAEATTALIVEAPEVPGASSFLRGLSTRLITAILSSTPQQILEQIVDARRWNGLVKTLHGAPIDKSAWLRECRRAHGPGHDDLVFFGDSPDDAAAAKAAGCAFVAVANPRLAGSDAPWIEEYWPLIFRA